VTDLRELLNANLSASYSIDRERGGGGVSRVFVAEERALGRRVVLKVLPDADLAPRVEDVRRRIERIKAGDARKR
jgi:eukaryotic-like serine/threonine-protein kinase